MDIAVAHQCCAPSADSFYRYSKCARRFRINDRHSTQNIAFSARLVRRLVDVPQEEPDRVEHLGAMLEDSSRDGNSISFFIYTVLFS